MIPYGAAVALPPLPGARPERERAVATMPAWYGVSFSRPQVKG
jgi:hypothetical protein